MFLKPLHVMGKRVVVANRRAPFFSLAWMDGKRDLHGGHVGVDFSILEFGHLVDAPAALPWDPKAGVV